MKTIVNFCALTAIFWMVGTMVMQEKNRSVNLLAPVNVASLVR